MKANEVAREFRGAPETRGLFFASALNTSVGPPKCAQQTTTSFVHRCSRFSLTLFLFVLKKAFAQLKFEAASE